jgi:hypothetical protein
MLLTGILGDVTWSSEKSVGGSRLRSINDQLGGKDPIGNGLSEARLHIGFIHAAATYIGGRSRKTIFNISNSDAMRPWSVDGRYDRPIPRRLGEEAGIPRELFGQTKLATVVNFLPPYVPHGAVLRKEFFDFYRQSRGDLKLLYLRVAPRINFMLRRVYVSYIKLLKVALFLSKSVMGRSTIRNRQRDLSPQSNATLYPRQPYLKQRLRAVLYPRQRYLGQGLRAVLYAYCVNKAAKLYQDRRLEPSEHES